MHPQAKFIRSQVAKLEFIHSYGCATSTKFRARLACTLSVFSSIAIAKSNSEWPQYFGDDSHAIKCCPGSHIWPTRIRRSQFSKITESGIHENTFLQLALWVNAKKSKIIPGFFYWEIFSLTSTSRRRLEFRRILNPAETSVRQSRTLRIKKEATVGFEPTNNGFAIHRLSHLATSPDHNQSSVDGIDCRVSEA